MKRNKKLKAINMKMFILPFVIIAVAYLMIAYRTVNSRIDEYYSHLEQNSIKIAKSYSNSLARASEAKEVVEGLLDEKLLVAGESTALYNGQHSNKILEELAIRLEVDIIYSFNSEGEVIYSNTGEFIGWTADIGTHVYDFLMSGKNSFVEEIRKDAEEDVYIKYAYFKLPDGSFVQIGIFADTIQNFLGSFEIQYLLNEIHDDIQVEEISFIDNEFTTIGSTNSALIGQPITDPNLLEAIGEGDEHGVLDKEKELHQAYVPVYEGANKVGTLLVVQSITEAKAIESNIKTNGVFIFFSVFIPLCLIIILTYKKSNRQFKLAYYDSLTNLPNAEHLKEFLNERFKKSRKTNQTLILINISNFRAVNLTFGYMYGDEILKRISSKLKNTMDTNQFIFRFTADRFVLYIEDDIDQKALIDITRTISSLFTIPFVIQNENQYLGVQFGIVEINEQNANVDRLLKDASIVLSHIDDRSDVNFAFFNNEMEKTLQREKLIEREIRAALSETNKNSIYLNYQPKVDLKTDEVIGYEALARMESKILGLVPPLEFIDIAERNQLIVPLGNLILKLACDFILQLYKNDICHIKVSVNISGIQLLRDDFIDTVRNIITKSGINSNSLEFEITESILLANYKVINEKLRILRQLGIDVSLDDFGTGFSSLGRLEVISADILKIDRHFITRITNDDVKRHITSDIISMAHKLGLKVVAEGVETETQKNYLVENNCDIMQGYLYSKPLSVKHALDLLNSSQKIKK